MAIRRFTIVQVTSEELMRVQSNIQSAFDALLESPFAQAQLIKSVSLQAGSQLIGHGLGRNFKSWGWLNPSAATSLSNGVNPDPSLYVAIVATAPATVDLVVL